MTKQFSSAHWDSYRFLFRAKFSHNDSRSHRIIANAKRQLSSRNLRTSIQPSPPASLHNTQIEPDTPSSTFLPCLLWEPSLASPANLITPYLNCYSPYRLNNTSTHSFVQHICVVQHLKCTRHLHIAWNTLFIGARFMERVTGGGRTTSHAV